jgi:two-component system NtrC family response regulator
MDNLKVLIVDDKEDFRELLSDRLQAYGYETLTAVDGIEALEKVKEASPELVLLDIMFPPPSPDGLEILGRIKREYPATLVIMMTAYGTIEFAVNAMRQGAYDFIQKSDDLDIIRTKVEKALERQLLIRENEYLRLELEGEYGEIIGRSEKMMDVLKKIERVAPTDLNVLITGETGTGKELVARALHRNSLRSDGPFIPVNCSAIQATLVESEIFGHEKGAFTGAQDRKLGKMQLANEGTLFLDEIGDMAYELQAKLLRAIEEKEFERLGGTSSIKVNVRFIAATNRDLQEAIEEDKFRDDLFYRLNGIPIDLPPLREIREDIPLLVEHFLKYAALNNRIVQITDEAMELLMGYRWPGNIRELMKCIERTIILTDSNVIRPEHLPPEVRTANPAESSQEGVFVKIGTSCDEAQKALILKTVANTNTHEEAAAMLGISVRNLQYKLKEYNDEASLDI